jgi:hypothetical protein
MLETPRLSKGMQVAAGVLVVAIFAAWIVPSCRSAGDYRVEISGPAPYQERLCAGLAAAGAAQQISKDARPVLGILGTGSKAEAEIGVLPASGDKVVLQLTLRRKDAKGLSKSRIQGFFKACEYQIRKMLPEALAKCAKPRPVK